MPVKSVWRSHVCPLAPRPYPPYPPPLPQMGRKSCRRGDLFKIYTSKYWYYHLLKLLPPDPLGIPIPLPLVLLQLLHLGLVEAIQVVLEEVQVPEAVDVDLVVAAELPLQLIQFVSERRSVRLAIFICSFYSFIHIYINTYFFYSVKVFLSVIHL